MFRSYERIRPAIDKTFLGASFAAPFAVYCTSAQHGVKFWDTGEFQTVPYILGIAHPTGFPAYVLLGFIFSHIVAVGSVAFRMSVFSAFCVSIACTALYCVLRGRSVNAWAALVAALAFAFGPVTMVYAVRAEVHTLALCFESLALLFILIWARGRRARDAVLAAMFQGLALATHPVAMWLLPGLAIVVIANRRFVTRRLAAWTIAALLAPLLLYLYLPIRSAVVYAQRIDPTLRLGIPPGQPFWDYGHPMVWNNFVWMISGSQFEKGTGLAGILHLSGYPAYFSAISVLATSEFGPILVVFALLGMYALWRQDRASAVGAIVCGACFVPFAFSYAEEVDKMRYVLGALWINALLIGFGVQLIVEIIGRKRPIAAAVAALAVVVILTNQLWQQTLVNIPENRTASAYVARVHRVTPENAVLVAPWIYVTPLGYSAYVEHALGDRLVYNTHIESSTATIQQLAQQRPTFVILEKGNVAGLHLSLVSSGDPEILRVIPAATR